MRDLGIIPDTESGGTHTSRTIMLRELRLLLAACPPDATPDVLAEAVLQENVLAKTLGEHADSIAQVPPGALCARPAVRALPRAP